VGEGLGQLPSAHILQTGSLEERLHIRQFFYEKKLIYIFDTFIMHVEECSLMVI
jgi:hypothetical protein